MNKLLLISLILIAVSARQNKLHRRHTQEDATDATTATDETVGPDECWITAETCQESVNCHFDEMDSNGDGTLTAEDFGEHMNDGEGYDIFDDCDADGDGQITKEELQSCYCPPCINSQTCREWVGCQFLIHDTNGNGKVGKKELTDQKMKEKGRQSTRKEARQESKEEIEMCDTDDDNKLTLEEVELCFCGPPPTETDLCYMSAETCSEATQCHFDELDANNDGQVTAQEYQEHFNDGEEAAWFVDTCDKDKDGVVTVNELIECNCPPCSDERTCEDWVGCKFDIVDTNKNEKVGKNELANAIQEEQGQLTKQEAKEIAKEAIAYCDTDEDGKLDKAESVECVCSFEESSSSESGSGSGEPSGSEASDFSG